MIALAIAASLAAQCFTFERSDGLAQTFCENQCFGDFSQAYERLRAIVYAPRGLEKIYRDIAASGRFPDASEADPLLVMRYGAGETFDPSDSSIVLTIGRRNTPAFVWMERVAACPKRKCNPGEACS